MEAGRELDELIAVKVMGQTDFEHGEVEETSGGDPACSRCGEVGHWGDNIFGGTKCIEHYSTWIGAAWEVVEHFVGKDCRQQDFFIECWSDGEWFVAFHPVGYSSRQPTGTCDGRKTGQPSAPLAICRAALKAVGAEVK